MSQGYFVIYVTPAVDLIPRPDGWQDTFDSDPLTEPKTIFEDRFVDFEQSPTAAELEAAKAAHETIEELRHWSELGKWRLRVRYPVQYTVEQRGGIVRLYELVSPKLPAAWGRKAVFWGVLTTASQHKLLHQYIYTTLGFGPVAGALAALDPTNQTQFLAKAVQTATGLTNAQQLTRVTAIRNALVTLGYEAADLSAIVAAPADKTEDDLVRALVKDLGFTMADLRQVAMKID